MNRLLTGGEADLVGTAAKTNRIHQTRTTPTGRWHIRVTIDRSWHWRRQFARNLLGTPVQQWKRACDNSTCTVDVLDAGNNWLGLLSDRLHVSQAVIEVIGDPVEQHANDEQEHRQHSDQRPDADYCEYKKEHGLTLSDRRT